MQKIVYLSSISVSFEMKPELKNVVLELTSESTFVRILPFSIDYLESYVFIWWPSVKPENGEVRVIRTSCLWKKEKNTSYTHH